MVTAVRRPAADRASAYGLDPLAIDGNDADVVYEDGAGGGCPGPVGSRAELDRGGHVPSRRPLPGRPGQVPAGHGGGRMAGQGPYSSLPRAAPGRRSRGSVLDRIEAEARAEVDHAREAGEGGARWPTPPDVERQVFADGGALATAERRVTQGDHVPGRGGRRAGAGDEPGPARWC